MRKRIGYAFSLFISKNIALSDFNFLGSYPEPEGSSLSEFEREQILKSGGGVNAGWTVKPKITKLQKFKDEQQHKRINTENADSLRKIGKSDILRPNFEVFIENELSRLNKSKTDFVKADRNSDLDDREFYGQLRGCFYPDGVGNRAIANGDCGFDTMETSPHFEQAFTHSGVG